MKIRYAILVLGLVWSGPFVTAQVQTNDAQQRALEVLRKTMDSLDKKPYPKPTQRPASEPTFADVERLYLQGKISAKDLQKYLEQHKIEPSRPAPSSDAQSRALEVLRNEINKPEGTAPANPPAASNQPTVASKPLAPADSPPPSDHSTLSDVEKKMDELLRLKEAREKATNAVPNSATNATDSAGTKSKRERLNDLLSQVIAGKISDAEYKQQREKITQEPD